MIGRFPSLTQVGQVLQMQQRWGSLGVEFQKFELGQTLPGFSLRIRELKYYNFLSTRSNDSRTLIPEDNIVFGQRKSVLVQQWGNLHISIFSPRFCHTCL